MDAVEQQDIVHQPKILIADTIKGRGVSFMEKISELASCQGKYLWHSGAPGDEPFQKGVQELLARVNGKLSGLGLPKLVLKDVPIEIMPKPSVTKQYVAGAYGEELVALAAEHSEIVVLDGDLSADCKVRDFEQKYPHRFIENGIAEQAHERLALRIDIRSVVVGNVVLGPCIEFACQCTVPILEERPVEIARIAHDQLPSKRGFCFATNAL